MSIIKVGNWEPQDPLLKKIIGIFVAIFAIGLTFLILLGVMGPLIGLVLLIIVIAIIGKISLSLLALLIPLVIIGAPIAFFVWLIMILL